MLTCQLERFAEAALTGVLASSHFTSALTTGEKRALALECYEIAESMMVEARKREASRAREGSKPMKPFVTPEENEAAQKVHDDYWRQGPKILELGISNEQYNEATKKLWNFDCQKRVKRSHALAHFLLSHPDIDVIGDGVGQGSNECGDDHLWEFEMKDYGGAPAIILRFGDGPLT